jgi:two-component system, NtrC family, response regulator HydG
MSKTSKKTALIVDEGQDFRDLFVHLLEFLQFEVTCVENGEKAVEKVKENPYYLVLMEVRMPGITGLEALKQMKALRPGQRVIMLSNESDPMYMVERLAFQEGAVECLLKPVDLSDMDRILRETTTLLGALK